MLNIGCNRIYADWNGYWEFQYSQLPKKFVDQCLTNLRKNWSVYEAKAKSLFIPAIKKLGVKTSPELIWDLYHETLTREMLLYTWGASVYRTNLHQLGYDVADIDHMVWSIVKLR